MVERLLKWNKKSSVLLFGPRGSGKSTLLNALFPATKRRHILWINLLDTETEEALSRRPANLKDRILAEKPKLVIIDEVQKVPALLDIAHEMMEAKGIRFILTGSSARKLKRGFANLLAGRAFFYQLDPLTHLELGESFHLQSALEYGLLPKIYFPDTHRPKIRWSDKEKNNYLQTYARVYLKEEIQLEQIVRKIQSFRNFLEIAAQMNGKIIEYSKISNDVGVDEKTVAEYFQILEDTLVGFFLNPYHRSLRKRMGKKPKFYLFDPGVKRALDRSLTLKLLPQTSAYGEAFEHFVILEFHKIAKIVNPDIRFSFIRTSDGLYEVDLVIERPGKSIALVEIKSSENVDDRSIKKLKLFEKDFKNPELYILSREKHARLSKGVHLMPWQEGIKKILLRLT